MLGRKGLTMPEMQEIVEDGARRFEAVELKLDKAHSQVLTIIGTITDGQAAQMTGVLNAGRLKNLMRQAAGDIGRALATIYAVHQECTKIAQTHDVDIPTTLGGGDR